MSKKIRVAILSQDIRRTGGVGTLTKFLGNYLNNRPEFHAKVLVYAPFNKEPDLNVSLLNAFNLGKGIGKRERLVHNLEQILIGTYFPEIETQRYDSNRLWQETLNDFDIFCLVTGAAMLGFPLVESGKKYVSWIATTIRDERERRMKTMKPAEYFYNRLMLPRCVEQEEIVLKNSSHIFALSQYTEDITLQEFPHLSSVPFSLAFSPVDLSKFPMREKENTENPYLLFVGRFNDERKNIPLLLEAYHTLSNKVPSVPKLIIAGAESAPKESLLQLVSNFGLKDKVEFRCDVPLADLPGLYRGAQFFVLSSNQEGLGIVLLEAMASGTPVISTRCGGPEVIIEHEGNGLFAENNNVNDLAEKMEILTNHSEVRKIYSIRGRETVEKKFSVEAIGNHFVEVFRKVYPEVFEKALKSSAS
ncbi:MAG: glycosyltransferase family 4 protein [Chloroherpetonaceae bacterium]|nr:glycosyltransferase family 4 protein [Chloroherpetonaceae bacterium]